ncbi:tetratricopeptide repeat protein [Saccharothrix sp. ST-888]|uniref:tetratricopeptide repeat protein n=1 Tax=Saccharothrix sp. ST-888 TaxID=1427391 RepID=UPI0009E5BE8F|nr:tetratricopeptide repeat protein [Saccharothrix sp. ST-888]
MIGGGLNCTDRLHGSCRSQEVKAMDERLSKAIALYRKRKAIMLYRKRRYAEAETLFKKLAQEPSTAELGYFGMGVIRIEVHDSTAAKNYLLRCVDLSGQTHAGAMCQLGWLEEERGDLPEAANWYARALKAQPGHEAAERQLAGIHAMWQQHLRQKEPSRQQRGQGEPSDGGAMFERGRLEEERGNLPEAANWYAQAKQLNHPAAAQALARVHASWQQLRQREQVLSWHPGRPWLPGYQPHFPWEP